MSPILIRRTGAVVRRHEPRIGLRWTWAAPSRMRVQGGAMDWAEPRECLASRVVRTALDACEAFWAKQEACVRQNRVVLAVVATAKPCGGGIGVNRRYAGEFREVREARRNSAPGRARH